MARQTRRTDGISFRSFDNAWYSSIGGKYAPLRDEGGNKIKGKESEALAKKAFYQAAIKAGEGIPEGQTAPTPTVFELCKSYTTFLKANRAPSSYNNAKETLTGFLQFVGNDRKADSLQRHELRNFIDSKTTWGTHRQGSGIAHVVAAYNYGIEKGSIKTNPFNKFKKPANQSRVVLLSQEQEQAIKAAIGNKPFGDYWQFLLLSGARPDEGARVEAKHLQETAQGLQIVLQEHKAARKTGKVRVIYLNPEAAATFAATCYGLRFKEPLPLRHKPQRFRRQLDLDGNGKGAAIAAPFLLRYGETKTPLLPCGNKGVHGILGFSKSI